MPSQPSPRQAAFPRLTRTVRCLLAVAVCATPRPAPADEAAAPTPIVQLLKLSSPIEGDDYASVSRAALRLQSQSVRDKRPAYLILEIPDGASQFHQVYGLAGLISSNRLPNVSIVAWLPQSVTGHNALLALVADEIVMAPEAELGDLGRGKALEADPAAQVAKLVARGRNPLVTEPVAQAMLDPAADLQRLKVITVDNGERRESIRFLTSADVKQLQNRGAEIPEVEEVKTAGARGVFSGVKLKQLGIVVTQLSSSLPELAKRYGFAVESLAEPEGETVAVRAKRIELKGMIDWETEFMLTRQIDRAVNGGANLILVEIDSPGGIVGPSVNLAEKLASLAGRSVRTVAYIPREAISGGALVALGCDEIYLHRDARFGDAGPIEIGPGGQFEHADEKMVSYLRSVMEGLAEQKGRPRALLVSMVDMNHPVFRATDRETGRVWYLSENELRAGGDQWAAGDIVDGTQQGRLLSVTGRVAEELALAEAPVGGFDDLQLRLGIPLDADLEPMQRHWVDNFVILLNSQAAMFLLFVGGIAFIYLEMHAPMGFFGLLSALCFVLFFWARFLGGTAEWLEVILFLVGLLCVALEIFVIPGVGVVGFGGGVLIIASLVMASQTFGDLSSGDNSGQVLRSLGTLGGAVLTVILFAVVMSHFLPQLPLFNKLILTPPGFDEAADAQEPRLKPADLGNQPFAGLVGQTGKAATLLKPFGKAQIEGQLLEVVSQGELVDAGTPIEVIAVEGRKIIVRPQA